MGRRSKSREISKARLGQGFSDDEATYYRKYFRKLGGKGSESIELSKVKKFLQRSELSEDILNEILKIATSENAENLDSLDLEAFCVACRLVAHAQEIGVVQAPQVGEVPSNAPWFSELTEPEQQPEQQQKVETVEEFDFEAVALGVNAAFSGAISARVE